MSLMHQVRTVGLALLLGALAPGANAQAGTINVGDATIYYEAVGRGPAVVLIHGWALNLREWDDQIPALVPSYRVVAYDRRGYGKSTGIPDISADPGDLLALLDTLGVDLAVLVGHSGGSQVTYRFAAAFPGRVRGLVLYGAGNPPEGFPLPQSGQPLLPDVRPIARQYGLDSVLKAILARPSFSDLQSPEVQNRIAAIWATYTGKDLLEDHPPSGRFPPARFEDVKRWQFPTLFLVGETEAPWIRLIADSLSRWMPNARTVVIPGGGHGVHLREPERFNRALLGFLEGIAKRR